MNSALPTGEVESPTRRPIIQVDGLKLQSWSTIKITKKKYFLYEIKIAYLFNVSLVRNII